MNIKITRGNKFAGTKADNG